MPQAKLAASVSENSLILVNVISLIIVLSKQ